MPAVVVAMEPGFDGVLGCRVFADLLLTFDGPGRRVVLERGRLPAPNGAGVPALEPGDLDGDGDVDIVLGSLTDLPGAVPQRLLSSWSARGLPVRFPENTFR